MANRTMTQLLGEKQGTVLVADLRDFSTAAAGREPTDVGLWLTSYYEYVGEIVAKHGGRLVKFLGDGVLAAFFGPDHRRKALAAVGELALDYDGWLQANRRVKLPAMEYSLGVASGPMLEGEIGTDRVVFYDVLGAPVNLAFALCALAEERGEHHLLDDSTVDPASTMPPLVPLEGAEIASAHPPSRRLFRLDTPGARTAGRAG